MKRSRKKIQVIITITSSAIMMLTGLFSERSFISLCFNIIMIRQQVHNNLNKPVSHYIFVLQSPFYLSQMLVVKWIRKYRSLILEALGLLFWILSNSSVQQCNTRNFVINSWSCQWNGGKTLIIGFLFIVRSFRTTLNEKRVINDILLNEQSWNDSTKHFWSYSFLWNVEFRFPSDMLLKQQLKNRRRRHGKNIRRALKESKRNSSPKKIGWGRLISDGENDDYCD